MSKWTLETIKQTIKRGDTCSINGDNHKERMVVKIYKDWVVTHHSQDMNTSRWQTCEVNEFGFKFYRNGEEILPPKERELIKFTEKLVDSIPRFVTDGGKRVYPSDGKLLLGNAVNDYLIEEIPNARVLYRYADTLEIAHWGEK